MDCRGPALFERYCNTILGPVDGGVQLVKPIFPDDSCIEANRSDGHVQLGGIALDTNWYLVGNPVGVRCCGTIRQSDGEGPLQQLGTETSMNRHYWVDEGCGGAWVKEDKTRDSGNRPI